MLRVRVQTILAEYGLDVDVDKTFGKQAEQLGKNEFEKFLNSE